MRLVESRKAARDKLTLEVQELEQLLEQQGVTSAVVPPPARK